MSGADPEAGVRIAMWSGPRNISTALMRSFGNRPDTVVLDEPFYAVWLRITGAPHPMRDEILAAHETDWRRVEALTDEEIEAAVREDPDAATIADEAWFDRAQLVVPAHLKHLFVQIDEDLMAWFRQQGEDWPARINAVLRKHVAGQRRRRRPAG